MAALNLSPEERIAALEQSHRELAFQHDVLQVKCWKLEDEIAALQRRQLTVADLPLSALIRAIENAGMLNASLALEPGSITPELLAEGVVA